MDDLVKAILDQKPDRPLQLLYGVATATNTVQVAGADTAVLLPALRSVLAGEYCAVLAQGADRLILGPVGVTEGLVGTWSTSVVDAGTSETELVTTGSRTWLNGHKYLAIFRVRAVEASSETGATLRVFAYLDDGQNPVELLDSYVSIWIGYTYTAQFVETATITGGGQTAELSFRALTANVGDARLVFTPTITLIDITPR